MKISILKSCAGLTFSFIEGQDVVDAIAETATDYSDRPLEDQVMKTVVVETFGEEYPEPETM